MSDKVPHGFDVVEYGFFSRAYSDAELEEMRGYYEEVEDRYRMLKQMCIHISAARGAAKRGAAEK